MTKSLDLKRDDPRSHLFDTTAPSISRRALDHADLLSGDYWGELRTFLWVAKAGSLSKAAELLGSSHATVGREIRRLQDQMGSQLVVLTKNGAQLTQKGHALTDELLRLDQRLFSIASDLRAEKAEAEGAVRLGITDGLGVCFLVPELRRFSKKYPKSQVHLKSLGNFKNLRENQTDVILGFSPDPSNDMTCARSAGSISFRSPARPTSSAWASRRTATFASTSSSIPRFIRRRARGRGGTICSGGEPWRITAMLRSATG
jgi:DNA-binding transcriptional LysR family regulator